MSDQGREDEGVTGDENVDEDGSEVKNGTPAEDDGTHEESGDGSGSRETASGDTGSAADAPDGSTDAETTGSGAPTDGDPDEAGDAEEWRSLAETGGGETLMAVDDEGATLLETRDLDAGYGDLQILDGVDMEVADGEYVTIVGPNGAGKSTVMKSIFGLTNHMGGSVVFDGEDITGLKPEEVIHKGLSYVPQNDNIFNSLTVRENLEMGAYILDEVPEDQLQAIYDRFPILEERETQKAGTMSGGQQQMLAMGRALMLDPDLLMLDEPSAGLAPDLVDDMFDRIDAINDAGTAVLMVEQNAKEALRRCDRGYVLVQGQNRFEDRGEVLLNDEDVRQQFLGG